jgi:hypothetical protein
MKLIIEFIDRPDHVGVLVTPVVYPAGGADCVLPRVAGLQVHLCWHQSEGEKDAIRAWSLSPGWLGSTALPAVAKQDSWLGRGYVGADRTRRSRPPRTRWRDPYAAANGPFDPPSDHRAGNSAEAVHRPGRECCATGRGKRGCGGVEGAWRVECGRPTIRPLSRTAAGLLGHVHRSL